ncbi:MAG: N-acetyltransferase [Alphaproteobacteria bacterium]|nr:N-acetyltransferase [Alphaproteobacteria bacterium]
MATDSGQIDHTASIGSGFSHGFNLIVGTGVSIGEDVEIGHNVIIHADVVIGNGVRIADNAVLGRKPAPGPTSTAKVAADLPALRIGDHSMVGVGAVIYAGTLIGSKTVIADQAFVRESCVIGDLVIVGRGSTLENRVIVGSHAKIQSQVYIPTDTVIEEHVFLAPCVVMANDNFMGRTKERFKFRKGPTIRRGARIGANAVLLPGVEIGAEAFVASASVVTRDVPPGRLVMGVPAKAVRDVPEREMIDHGEH